LFFQAIDGSKNLIIRHIFKKVFSFSAVLSVFAFIVRKVLIWFYKNFPENVISNQLKKSHKTHAKKVRSFYFYHCVHDTHMEFFGENFLCVYEHFLLNLKPKSDEGAQKTKKSVNKSVLFTYIFPLFYIYFRSGRLHFVRKSQNRCTLVNIRTYTVLCTQL
jgi:hypothetical protein